MWSREIWKLLCLSATLCWGLPVPVSRAIETASPPSPAVSVTEEVCHQPDTGPDRYLATPEELPIVPTAPPSVADFPEVALPGLWLFELILFWVLALAAAGAAIYCFRQVRKLTFNPIDRATVATLVLSVSSVCCLITATNNLLVGRQLTSRLQAARAAWQQGEHREAEVQLQLGRKQQQRTFMGWLPFYRPALERVDVDRLRTVNGISAVHRAIDLRSPEAAGQALEYLDAGSTEAVAASIAALSHRSEWRLVAGETAGALADARRADRLPLADGHTRSNLCAARFHQTVALVRAGEQDEASHLLDLLDPPECDLDPLLATAARGLVARTIAGAHLQDPEALNTAAAVEIYEEAYGYGQQRGQDLPFLACDLVAALDVHSVASLANDEPGDAVDALDRSEVVLPDRPFVQATLPKALYALGSEHLHAEAFEPAIEAMDRGYRLTEGKDEMLVKGLARAYLAQGAKQAEAGETDRAIGSFEESFGVDSTNPITRRALADSLLKRGDEHLKAGNLTSAEPDFIRAAEVSVEHRPTANMRRRIMAETPRRLRELNRKPGWLGIPQLHSELPRDENADGVAERVLYYGAETTEPIAVGELSPRHLEPRRLLLLDKDKSTAVMLRDMDGDGELDERTTYSGGVVQGLIADVDDDGLQDVQVSYRGGVEFARQHLSGRIRMVMREGVVGDTWMDFFSQADAYVKLFHNGRLEFVSDTVKNSNFPIWNEGVVIDYRYTDEVFLEIWDEDWPDPDDLIDTYSTSSLPTSGTYRFSSNKAAIRMSVTPSDLPPGHHVRAEPEVVDENYFRDHTAAVREYGDLIATARADAVRADVMHFLAKEAIDTAVDATTRNPVERTVLKLIAGIVMDDVVK